MAKHEFKVSDVIKELQNIGDKRSQDALNLLENALGEEKISLTVPDPLSPDDLPGDLPQPPINVVAALSQIAEAINKASSMLDQEHLPQPAAPSAPPVNVVDAFSQIAEAINKASSMLDQQHLMVASGSVTADVNVKIRGSDVGAESHLALQIGQKPYS